jgi:hypothetical protein
VVSARTWNRWGAVGLTVGLVLAWQVPSQGLTLDHDLDHDHGLDRARTTARTISVNPATGPDFELPFVCGQVWNGSSRSGHSPSYYTVDFNRNPDRGQPALASAAGVVTKVVTLTGSYGRYVVIDHGGGWSTLYAHLDGFTTTVGARVDQGDQIGIVGGSGGVTGPHLHFEERKDGAYFAPYFHRQTFKMNSDITSQNCTDRPVVGDWNGDGKADAGVMHTGTTATYWLQAVTPATNGTAAATSTSQQWGIPGDAPVVGDYDGDGLSQIGVKRRQSATWYLRSATGAMATVTTAVGTVTDTPVAGDWDGNGKDNLGYYRPATSTFYLRGDNLALTPIQFGLPGDLPITGDWDGDGRTDVGVWRAGVFYMRIPTATWSRLVALAYGNYNDTPVVGDWNGDGTADVGVWRPSTGQFFERVSATEQTWFAYGTPRG